MWLIFICLLIFFFFISPAYKVWKTLNRARRQAREMNDAFRRAAGIDPDEERRKQQEQQRASRRGGWTSPTPRRKKIGKDVGEYVKFKEVTVSNRTSESQTADSATGESCRIEREEQIVDVRWEDLPPQS